MKKGAIFDMDGLLFDTEKIYRNSWIETIKYYGKGNEDEFLKNISGASAENCLKLIKRLYPDIDADEFFKRAIESAIKVFNEGVELMPGVVEILSFFQENGVKNAIASSSSAEVVNRNIERANIKKYFSAIISGEEIKNGKPAPDIFLLAAKKINVPANDCYVFEDSFNGIRGAYAAGCSPIMIPDTMKPDDEIKKICDGIYTNLIDAMNALKNS